MPITVPSPTGGDDFGIISGAIAQAAAVSQSVSFQESAVYQVSQPICIGNGNPVPRGLYGNGATLKATTPNMSEVLRISNPHTIQNQFFAEQFILDAAKTAYRALTINGMQQAFLRQFRLMNATSICFAIDAGKGFGVYYNEISGFMVTNSAWMGLRWQDNLTDYAAEGSHIQGNTIKNFNVAFNQANAWFTGVQGSIEGRFEWSQQPGILIDNSIQFSMNDCYTENNMVNGVDTALQVQSSATNILRRGGRWNGAVIGTVATE